VLEVPAGAQPVELREPWEPRPPEQGPGPELGRVLALRWPSSRSLVRQEPAPLPPETQTTRSAPQKPARTSHANHESQAVHPSSSPPKGLPRQITGIPNDWRSRRRRQQHATNQHQLVSFLAGLGQAHSPAVDMPRAGHHPGALQPARPRRAHRGAHRPTTPNPDRASRRWVGSPTARLLTGSLERCVHQS
jgi:hypothetical protein